jgi:nicotinamide-nucleotide amidase
MIGEIIAIGDELTSGRILNSTSQFAAHNLFAMGHEVVAMSTIGDSPELIGAAVRKAIDRADFIIVTGGLGPTSDDLTNEAVAAALGRPATFHPEILDQIKDFLAASDNIRPDKTKGLKLEKLAWLPAGAEVLKPGAGMAGYLLVHDQKPIFFMPGVPHEMRELLVDVVIPKLDAWKAGENRHLRQKVYRIFGIPESEVNQRLKHLEDDNSLIRIGYYPVFPETHLSLTALGAEEEDTDALFEIFETRINSAVGEYIYAHGDESMAATVGALLRSQNRTLAAAESCTGGLLSYHITTVAGSSDYFCGGVTAYSNEIKTSLLQVKSEIVEQFGAVSGETAKAMADGARNICGADIAISITGIAGPSGGTSEKPVGTVCFGLSTAEETRDYRFQFSGDRQKNQIISAHTGLDLIRRKLLEEK